MFVFFFLYQNKLQICKKSQYQVTLNWRSYKFSNFFCGGVIFERLINEPFFDKKALCKFQKIYRCYLGCVFILNGVSQEEIFGGKNTR